MGEEQNRFSLRKLSVGLASVLIGVSIFGTSQTVKADTVADQNTSAVTSNAQSGDTQENGNAVKSTFSNDNQVNNAKSNLIQTQVEGKKDQKQDSVPNTQEATDGSNLDAEKDIVRTSSLQEPDNQSNNHAEDNSQTQNSKKLDLTRNSQKLNQKALVTNLIQDNKSADDLATQKDPSKLHANDFAAGTKWTTAGWTRTNPQYVAKSSKMTLNIPNNKLNSKLLSPTYIDFDVDFTIDKNELSKNRSFLVGSIQTTFYNRSQSQTDPDFDNKAGLYAGFDYHNFTTGNNDIISDNQKLGHLIYGNNGSEADLYFVSDIDKSDAVDDITVHYQTKTGTISLDRFNNPDYRDFAKNGFTKYPIIQNIITNSDIYQNTISTDSTVTNPINPDIYESWYLDGSWDVYGHQFGKYNDTPIQYVLKVKSTDPIANTYHTDIWRNYFFFNKDNQMTSQSTGISIALKRVDKGHNLTALDLMNQTKFGESAISWQSDGSYLVCVKYDPNSDAGININDLRSAVEKSYLANIGDPTHKQQIIDNTVNYYSNNKRFYNTYAVKSTFTADKTQPHTVFVTDVTPNQTASSTQTVKHIVNGITDIVGETYRHVNLSYIDDVTNKSISTDVLIGRKNQDFDYIITVPQGYLLVNPTDGTNYKWNADHTKITYTFVDDQTLNEKNPIVIHLKHKIQDVSATDPNAKQNNRYRMIENLPDGTKKTLIDLEIESHRTATKDLVTGKTTYSDWISKDAVITNHTNNGNAGDPSFIWKVPLDWFNNCTRTFSIPNGYEKVEQNGRTLYTSPLEKDNNGSYLICFISYPDGGVGLDFEIGFPKYNVTTYKAMPASCDFVINYQHNTQKVTDPSQLQTTGKRTITISMPKGHGAQMTIIQTVGYKRTGSLDLYTGKTTYTDWVFDADTSNVTVDGQPSTQYQAYILKDGVVNYAPIKLPHINGYKAHLVKNKINPAMLMVSFMAVPSETKPSLPNEETPSKPSAPADNPNKPASDLQQRVVTELNNNDSGWTMPETSSTYTVEVPADDVIDLSDLVIAEPVHAMSDTIQIPVTKRFKLSKKHSIKHLKHRKKAVRTFKKYRL